MRSIKETSCPCPEKNAKGKSPNEALKHESITFGSLGCPNNFLLLGQPEFAVNTKLKSKNLDDRASEEHYLRWIGKDQYQIFVN